MAYVFDLETDGFLDKVTKIHCMVILNTETRNHRSYVGHKVAEGITQLATLSNNGHKLVGHNAIKYDYAVIDKLYPQHGIPKDSIVDTLVLSRLIHANLSDTDLALLKKGTLPSKSFGSHSLEAWGYRLGEHKGDYKDWFKAKCLAEGVEYTDGLEWENYCPEMLEYNEQDCRVTADLLAKLEAANWDTRCLELEHKVAWLMAKQERNGFVFDVNAGVELYSLLAKRKAELTDQCAALFPPWDVCLGDFIPKVNNKKQGYVKGVPIKRYKTVVFNPSSRDHIANRLITLYGWEPLVLTEGGKPKVDETVLASLPYEPCKLLSEFLMVQKRISQLAEGDNAWLNLVKEGRLHGSINTNGAVTGRATHSRPNISQVPSSNSPYGHECRSLFTVPVGWTLVGADASGLELRCLAHYMARYDGGAYGTALLEGDIHTTNQLAAGLATRPQAKTFIYAFLYGAGDEKIGSVISGSASDGKKLKAKFLRNLPALGRLVEDVKEVAKRGYLVGLDGRRIYVRSAHAALNTLLQGAGAIVCKQWLVMLEDQLQVRGLKHGWTGDYCFCAWSHDEVQIACRTPAIAQEVAELATKCVRLAGEHFKFRCPTAGEYKIGHNWSDTH